MSTRIRGQEAIIAVTVNDDNLDLFGLESLMTGSFTKVRDFTVTERLEQTEENYLGETFTDLDQQLNGYDFSFTVDEVDAQAIDFMGLIAYNEEHHLPPPDITVAVTYIYRDGTTLPRTEIYSDCILKRNDRSIGGRTEYIQNSFEGKAKRRSISIG